MTKLEELLEDLGKMIQDYEQLYEEDERRLPERVKTYEDILRSKESSREMKAVAVLAKQNEYSDSARLLMRVQSLRGLRILGLHMRLLEISIETIKEQLTQSGILEKVKDIEDIKELKKKLDKTIALLKRAYEDLEKMRKTEEEIRNKDVPYRV